MSFTNEQYCAAFLNKTVSGREYTCCSEYYQLCHNKISYDHYCMDQLNFGEYSGIVEEIFAILDIILSVVIILISIFGKIEGTFKWCIANIAIFHLFYPVFTHFIFNYFVYDFVVENYKEWGWSGPVANVVVNSVLTLGTQGVTTSLAASLPLAINRYLLTHQSQTYEIFFGNKKRIVFWLFTYDLATFGTFYTMYILTTLSSQKLISSFSSIYYNITTVATVIIANSISLILMIFVLYHIYSSLALVKQLDQKQLMQERKRIAWLIVAQTLINCILCLARIAAFFNVSQVFAKQPPMECFGPAAMFYSVFSYCIQEFFVCIDGLLYIVFLSAYRSELLRFFKWILRIRANNARVTVLTNMSTNLTTRSANKSK